LLKLLTQFRADLLGQRFTWPVVTFVLITVNLMAWCAVAWVYHLPPLASQNSALLLRAGAVNGEMLHAGEWWRIIISQFLHVNFLHLVFNMIALLLLGGMLERESGSWRLIVLYSGSGVIGQLIGVAATPALVSSGASQAIMGLVGGTAVGLFRRPYGHTASIVILLAVIIIQATLDAAAVGYIKAGHLGGFCAGAAIGLLLRRPTARA
jgi:rhomboid protease GluP